MSSSDKISSDSNQTERQLQNENQNVSKTADQNQVALSMVENHENVKNSDNPKSPDVITFSIESQYQNTSKNPYKESTATVPHLIRKVPESSLTPKPFTSFNQVIIFSYISVLFFIIIGAFAAKDAMKAKIQMGKGLYVLAKERARRAVILSYISIASGVIVVLIVVLTNLEELK